MHQSPAVEKFVKSNSREWSWTKQEFFIALRMKGYEVHGKGNNIVVIQWDVNLRRMQNAWSAMFQVLDGRVVVRNREKLEKDGVRYVPEFVGGNAPKFAQNELLAHFKISESLVAFPEQAIEMTGKYWSDLDAGMQSHPDHVKILAFASEVPALAQWYELTESDYRNIAREYVRQIFMDEGIVLLPYPVQ